MEYGSKVIYNLKMGCQTSINCQQNNQRKYKFSAKLLHQSQNNPNNPQTTLNKSDRSDFENRMDRSIISYQQFLEINPDLKYPFDGLGNIQDQVGFLQNKVEKWYEQSRQSGLLNGNPFDALSLCYSLKKDVSEGLKWYQNMIEKYPLNEYLHFGIGNIYYKMQMYQQSQISYRKVIDINPRLDKAYQNIANIYCFKKFDNSQAEQWSKFALKLNPKNQYSLLINAIVNENVSQRINSLQKMLLQHPQYARVYNALGQAYMQKDKYKTSIKHFISGYTKNTNYYAIPCGLAHAHNKINKFDEAIVWSHKAIELNPSHHEPYHSLADAFKGKGMLAEAKRWYLKCIGINDQFDEAYLKLARIYMNQDEDQAIMYLEKYLQRNNDNAQVIKELAKLYRKKKQSHISVNHLLNMPSLESHQESIFLLGQLLEEIDQSDQSEYYFAIFIKNAQNKDEATNRVQMRYGQIEKTDRINAILQKVQKQSQK